LIPAGSPDRETAAGYYPAKITEAGAASLTKGSVWGIILINSYKMEME